LKSLEGMPEDVSRVLRQNLEHDSRLKGRIKRLEQLLRYQSINDSHGKESNAHQLCSHFQRLKEQLRTILLINGPENPSTGSLYGNSADLDLLLSTVFDDGNPGHPVRPADLVPDFPALTLYEVVQTLTGAAIHCWIFGSEFRPQVMTCTPMLQKYHEYIATLCTYPLECRSQSTCTKLN
jgi:hypothetical protein